MALLNLDLSQVEAQQAFEAIPAGWYNAMAEESEIKPTKDGSGAYLAVRFTIVDGQYINRKVFKRFNIQNANPQAKEIAMTELRALADAVGIGAYLQESSMLHNRPLRIRVKLREAADGYDASNDVNGYKPVEQAPAQQFAAPQAPAFAPPAPQYAPQQAPQYAPPAQAYQQPQQPAPQQQAPQQTWQAPPVAQPWQAAPVQQAPQQQAPQYAQPAQQFAAPQQQAPAPQVPPFLQQAPAQQAPAVQPNVDPNAPPSWAQ